MWISYRLYELLPRIYLAIGGATLIGAAYLGFGTRSATLYLLIALGCVAYGMSIMWLRYRYRRPRPVRKMDLDDPV